MCESELKLSILPDVLQEIVVDYAYSMSRVQVLKSLQTILDIVDMELPFFFLREKIWSWHWNCFLPNPVVVFEPIEFYNGRYCELFDDDALYCLLLGLDFRRKNVKLFGSRQKWLNRIVTSWRCVEPLAAFYRMLLRSHTPIMKKRGPLVNLFV